MIRPNDMTRLLELDMHAQIASGLTLGVTNYIQVKYHGKLQLKMVML